MDIRSKQGFSKLESDIGNHSKLCEIVIPTSHSANVSKSVFSTLEFEARIRIDNQSKLCEIIKPHWRLEQNKNNSKTDFRNSNKNRQSVGNNQGCLYHTNFIENVGKKRKRNTRDQKVWLRTKRNSRYDTFFKRYRPRLPSSVRTGSASRGFRQLYTR